VQVLLALLMMLGCCGMVLRLLLKCCGMGLVQ
jgi:hypothetical protein